MISRGISITANCHQEQCVHPTSTQQRRAGPWFRQIFHFGCAAVTPNDDLKLGHQKPHQPGARLRRSALHSPCAEHGPRRDTFPTLHSSCSSKAGAVSGYTFRCSHRATTTALLWDTKFWSHSALEGREIPLIFFLASFLAAGGVSSAFQLKRWRKST